METLKVKIVGRRFNHVKHEVKSGDTVVLIAEDFYIKWLCLFLFLFLSDN